MKVRGRSSPTSAKITMSGWAHKEKRYSPCSQTSSGGPLQRTVLDFSSSLISILRRGVDEAYTTHVEFSAQVLLEEQRFLPLWAVMGTGSMQRLIFVVERSRDEKQAISSVWGVSPEQQALG